MPRAFPRPRPWSFAAGLLLLVACLGGRGAAWAGPGEGAPWRLENGLEVLLQPAADATRVAVVLVLRVGALNDPPGRSGLTHLAEHLFVTAPAAGAPRRTVEDLLARYPDGHTAQTGDRHVIVGLVAPPERLEEELTELAQRLSALDVQAEDLERERGRVLLEVESMFDGGPGLAAMNRARERLLPTAGGGRRAGAPEHVKAVTLEELRAHVRATFQPRTAVLSLAGRFDPDGARALVTRLLAPLEGRAPPAAQPRPLRTAMGPDVRAAVPPAGRTARACLAFAVPAPDHADYPAFLLLAARLVDIRAAPRDFPPPFYYAPLDEPDACYVSTPLAEGEAPDAALARLEAKVRTAVTAPPSPGDALRATNVYGLLLGLVPVKAAQNPYLAALGPAARHVLGLDPARIRRALLDAKTLPLAEAAARLFDPLAAGAAVAVGR